VARRVALAATIAALIAGCGGGGDGSPPPRPVEKADAAAKLPAGWRTEVNRQAGFTIGVPPVWKAEVSNGISTQLTSPDKQVAIRVSADRTDEALALALDRNAADTASGLQGFSDLKLIGSPAPYPHRYEGASVEAKGTLAATGVPELLEVIVLRRDRLTVFPILVERRAGKRSVFAQQIDPIVHSLRGRPVSVPG
jgi:hypothetical protein